MQVLCEAPELRQLLIPRGEGLPEDEVHCWRTGSLRAPAAVLGLGDTVEAAKGVGPRARETSAMANALYSSNVRKDSKATARSTMESLLRPTAALSKAAHQLHAAWPLTHLTGTDVRPSSTQTAWGHKAC